VATVSSTGVVNSLTTGTSTIGASLGSVSAQAPLTVTAAVLQSVAITPTGASFPLGSSLQLTATGTYSDGSTQNLTSTVNWSVSNPSVGAVSSTGVATGHTTGTLNVVATQGGVTGNLAVTVTNAALVSIAVTPANQVIVSALGNGVQFTATGTYTDGSTQDLTSTAHWAISGVAVGTISQTGLFSATGVGVGTVTATSGTISGSTNITIVSLL
jgi:hypothetical protein